MTEQSTAEPCEEDPWEFDQQAGTTDLPDGCLAMFLFLCLSRALTI